MTPVKQTKLYSPDGIHNGNCLAACYASLLDLPLWMVPPFEDMFGRGEWYARIDEWLAKAHKLERVRANGHPVGELPEFYLACGRSARGVLHAVIYSNGALVHDPHYSDSGIADVMSVEYLRPLAA
ncbi:hypothetical protein [Paraburkholderia unamae]|uniref:NlpC/P60 family protein n=1 Tax=Paraburkholderia unamae TaxID=219649 RepID=A0ABX5K8R3_9BURK|nr:hypothetical protein [Paraburkholderia unamae]PVX61254.1 hypothetical protein C7402_14247 [Paraburkholderia unamae]